VDEVVFKNGFKDVTKGVVHYPVPKRGHRNQAVFRFVDVEGVIKSDLGKQSEDWRNERKKYR
jgi:hypothetical protein